MSDKTANTQNGYEARQEAKRERYQALADGATKKSAAAAQQASDMASVIPFGQPVLIGHHSEKGDRAYRARIGGLMNKSITEEKKADYYEQKAAKVGTGGISSDDPAAVEKLTAQLEQAQQSQEIMKKVNAIIRKKGREDAEKIADIVALGCFSEDKAKELLKPDFAGRIGFASYALSNNNANIKRIKDRISELEKRAQRVEVEREEEGYIYREDTTENRVMFIFEGKPDEGTRAILKRHAFKWSPSRGAWVRNLNNAGIYAAQCVTAALAAIGQADS